MLANCLFSRDPERPFDIERPRNWGSFGAELNGLKPWRRGGFRGFLGGWLVVENASKLSFFWKMLALEMMKSTETCCLQGRCSKWSDVGSCRSSVGHLYRVASDLFQSVFWEKESKLSQLTIQRAGNETLRTGTDLDTGKKRRFQKSNL